LAWDITWSFACKTNQIENSSEFKSGIGSQYPKVKNFAKNCWVVLVSVGRC
jgi:hypothetical protein